MRLSKRGAAQRAGFSEITWRQLEAGERQIARDVTTPVNPRDDTLAAAARAVNLDPAELFELVDRKFDPALIEVDAAPVGSDWQAAIIARLDSLEEEVRRLTAEAKRRTDQRRR
jgi:hypothetical protein